jgi:hypothetical protein
VLDVASDVVEVVLDDDVVELLVVDDDVVDDDVVGAVDVVVGAAVVVVGRAVVVVGRAVVEVVVGCVEVVVVAGALTVIVPVIDGWIVQWYGNEPAESNVCEPDPPDGNDTLNPSPVAVWSIASAGASLFVQVTVSPTSIVTDEGEKPPSNVAPTLALARAGLARNPPTTKTTIAPKPATNPAVRPLFTAG